jgi:Glycosyl hydrolase family 63 C-terminal domain
VTTLRTMGAQDAERQRLEEDRLRTKNWKRFGPYLAERQWGTVREDYSKDGNCWDYFTHDQARSRAYRFGEDGLLGFTDRECRLCFSWGLWNEKDPILKERLFGLTGPQGNHGEDAKECWYYLDATPTYSYTKVLYKYPQTEFPYRKLLTENARRGKHEPEYELEDTGIFDENRYFDVVAETAKRGPDDIVVRLTVSNRGPEAAPIHLLPQLWFRNTWRWGRDSDGYSPRGEIRASDDRSVTADHATLGRFVMTWVGAEWNGAETLFTENETNNERLFQSASVVAHKKDGFHERVVRGDRGAVASDAGSKFAVWTKLIIPAGASVVLRLRLCSLDDSRTRLDVAAIDRVFAERQREAEAFYATVIPPHLEVEPKRVARQAYAGLLFSKQFYHYVVEQWLEGDPSQPRPPSERIHGRNHEWQHAFMRDVISMPDKWEYPWFACWDLAFHMIPMAEVDIEYAKEQLLLFLREWYMHPNGQLPAYEFAFGDVNPPVHAWAAWRVYKLSGPRGGRDRVFLRRVFQKLLINFTWWVNRKDVHGRNLFSGGFLGLDNIGIFDRSQPLPTGGHLEQADGTAWMAFYCATMLSMALELAEDDPAAEDLASKFLEHFVAIVDAMNHLEGRGLWDEVDGFYYDHLHVDGKSIPLKVRSMVGLIPLFAAEILEESKIAKLKGFKKRFDWFVSNRKDFARHIAYAKGHDGGESGHYLISVPPKDRLERVLRFVLDENEFLSTYGVRSLSKFHQDAPYVFNAAGHDYRVSYVPAESDSGLFGGNSNWRGPIWFPVTYLLLEALERYDHFYGESLTVEYPTGSGSSKSLREVTAAIAARLASIFVPGRDGHRPVHGGRERYARDPHWKDLVLFYEYFHGDSGRGVGASHQTGWTALIVRWLKDAALADGAPRGQSAALSAR